MAQEKISTAQWVMERQLHWIAQAEVKVGVVVTIDLAAVGGLAAAYSSQRAPTAWAILFSTVSVTAFVLALFFAAMCLLPRIKPLARQSHLYFGQIAAVDCPTYLDAVHKQTDDDVLRDWLEQVHANARIASIKHMWVRRSVLTSFLAAVPWLLGVFLLVGS